jgi:hypothetical protein
MDIHPDTQLGYLDLFQHTSITMILTDGQMFQKNHFTTAFLLLPEGQTI